MRLALAGETVLIALGLFSHRVSAECPLRKDLVFSHDEIGELQVFRDAGSSVVAFASQMQVNTDGAPDSYHPDDMGITHICDGGSTGPNCK